MAGPGQFYLANENYRKKALLKEINLNRKEWRNVELAISMSEFSEQKMRLVIEASRVWHPYKLGIPDARKLGIALGEEWFKYPEELAAEKIESIQVIPPSAWKSPDGKAGSLLYSNGMRQVKFKTERKADALRLALRGQKCLGLGPFVVIKLDDKTIGKTMLNEEGWKKIILLLPEMSPGEHVLAVEFTNDLPKPDLGQDRKLYLGDLEVISLKNFELRVARRGEANTRQYPAW